MRAILEVEKRVMEYMDRHGMRYKRLIRLEDIVMVETFCHTILEAKIVNGRVYFKVDGKRTSLKKH